MATAEVKYTMGFADDTTQDITIGPFASNYNGFPYAKDKIIEFNANEGSKITKDKIRNLHLPDNATIGGIVRAGEGLLVNGETQIFAGDRVIVLCRNDELKKIEKFFQ